MNRILVHIPMIRHGEYDVFSKQNHDELLRLVRGKYAGVCPNLGNRLWFQGLISEISSPENHLEYFSPAMTKDYINGNYDFIIAPMANVFAVGFKELLDSLAERFRDIKIPVYVIACGVQADCYEQLDELCDALKTPASNFISSVYDTGGEFALRGYFTKEFFERLGFSSAVVTGCPSMYQMGRNLKIPEQKVESGQFRPLFNGNLSHYSDLIAQYENAEFFDQGDYYRELWDPSVFPDTAADSEHLKRLVKHYGYQATSWLLQDKIKLIPDMNSWRAYLISEKFTFSYGSRIHGSIMPILAGIPTVLESRDARTREMAEFFDIPCVEPGAYQTYDSLYELYQSVSFESFNRGYAERFDAYEAFLKKCGIVEKINDCNSFFHAADTERYEPATRQRRAELYGQLLKHRILWKEYDRLIGTKRRIMSKITGVK